MSRFDYVKYDQTAVNQSSLFKSMFEDIEKAIMCLSSTRAQSLILTKLEEAYMWVGKAIRDDQMKRETQSE